jgi:hypothetical protein
MRKAAVITAAIAGVLAAIGAGLVLLSGRAGAGHAPFVPIPAAANVAALSSTPMLGTPAAVSRLSPDLRPPNARIHTLGTAGFIWQRGGGSVCVLMASGPGGCLSSFDKPVLFYLTGMQQPDGSGVGSQQVSGLVPDSVKSLTFVTTSGAHVDVAVMHNAFAVEIPAGVGISGEYVTLANGSTFWNADRVTPPPAGTFG